MNRFRFNFGVLNNNALEGAIKITEDTIYNEEIGYGIEKVSKAVVREKGEERLRDFLIMNDNKFKVKLPNGKYNVRILAGDYEDDGDITVKVNIQDKGVGGIWVTDRSVCSNVYQVQVEEEKLEIGFSCRYISAHPRYASISAIDIAPVFTNTVEKLRSSIHIENQVAKVELTWDRVEGAYDYRINKVDKSRSITVDSWIVKEEYFVDNQVELCGEYAYTIWARDAYGFEVKGDCLEVCVVDGKEVTTLQCELRVVHTEDEKVKLEWDVVTEAIDYIIYRKTELTKYKEIGRTKALSFEDTSVYTCIPFSYALAVRTTSGISNKVSVITKATAPVLKRRMERLDRGLVAIKTKEGVFLSWRLSAAEYENNLGFNIYKNEVKINEMLLVGATNYLDQEGKLEDKYTVKAVHNMQEEAGYSCEVLANNYLPIPIDKPQPYTTPDGKVHEYVANDIAVGDLDGDGEYEIVLKWEAGPRDNAHAGYTGVVYLDAYKLNGTKLWRIDLGVNIRAGAHYTQMIVYDLDGDGKAELVCKTADGTKDGLGTTLGNAKADYRNEKGYIIEGPEYLSVFKGEDGSFMDTVPYDPPRGDVAEWGDSWGNRVDRFLAAVAYLDGVNPSVIMCRGYYDHGRPTVLVAYDLKEGKLQKRWKFLANKDQNIEYTNQGNHNIAVGDIDGDGKDEIIYGACAIDHDGTGIYSTRLGHGDAMHMGKFTPKTKGLDFYQIHEHSDCPYGLEVRNPATGDVLWGKFIGKDTGRGLTAHIDPRYEGNQVWSHFGGGLYTYEGEKITSTMPQAVNFAIWWDGDLQRELLDHKWLGSEIGTGIGQIYKWDWVKEELVTLLDTKDAYSNNYTKGNPCIQADLFGDWREEVIWRNQDSTQLRVYTTTDLTEHRIYTLMHDHIYRLGVAWQNIAYNQPPHTGFYIGEDMKEIPIPNSIYK